MELGDLAKLGGSLEALSGGTEHDYATVVKQQLAVPHGPVALPVADSLCETEHPDQPVHRRACVFIQQIGNDLWVRAVVRHDSHATAARRSVVGWRSIVEPRAPNP